MATSVLRFRGLKFFISAPGKKSCITAVWQYPRESWIHTSSFRKEEFKNGTASAVVETEHNAEDEFAEKFIPITRTSIIRHLMQQKDFLTTDELNKFEKFASALDSAIVNRYHGLLQEIKSLFDPINPDKDTVTTRQWNRRERLDNEFWLIQKLCSIMAKANFHELSSSTIQRALSQHQSREGVMVSVDTDKYDILRMWALGRETSTSQLPVHKRLGYYILRRPVPKPLEYYKRIVVAVRLKRDDKLMLKAFKEVPVNALEQLLPDGKIVMSQFDKTVIYSSVGIATVGLLAKLITYLAKMQLEWTLVLAGVTGLTAIRAWTAYKNRKNAYLVELSRMLYFKNIANNRGLLALLVDRAEDELLKETLLTYTFLCTNRPPSLEGKSSSDMLPEELGSMPRERLVHIVEDWVYQKTGTRVTFDPTDALSLLEELGILSQDYEQNLHVLPVESAIRNLPIRPQSLIARETEHDVMEGYDRHVSEEKEEEYKEEEKKRKKYGWF